MVAKNRRSENCIAPEDTPATPGKFGEPDTRTGAGATAKLFAPRHTVRGVDAEGCTHHWDSARNLLFVVSDAGLAHVEDLQGRDISEWADFVAETRGWV